MSVPTGVEPHFAASDHALVRAARLGDADAFTAIVQRYGPDMYRYATRLLHSEADAREALQEALVSAWQDIGSFESRSSVRTWLFRIVHHRAVDLQRKRKPVPVEDEVLDRHHASRWVPPKPVDPLQRVLDAELVHALQEALDALAPAQRAVWLLREVEGMSYAEVAETLSMTPDSVRGHLQRGRRELAERMATWR